MKTHKLWISAGLVSSLVCVALAQQPEPVAKEPPADSVEEKPKAKGQYSLEVFMRKKLDSSSKILEGLCLEDADLVKQGADELSAMSRVEIWNVMLDAEYRNHSVEFRDSAARVAEAAEQGDFDKAALRWFDVTMSCIECHEHVRADRADTKGHGAPPKKTEETPESKETKPAAPEAEKKAS